MKEMRVRIRSVRYKNSRASLHIFHNQYPNISENGPENFLGKIVENAKEVISYSREGSRLDGYIVIGLYDDSSSSIGFRIPDRIPSCLAPAYIAELLRRNTVTERVANRVFHENFEWVE